MGQQKPKTRKSFIVIGWVLIGLLLLTGFIFWVWPGTYRRDRDLLSEANRLNLANSKPQTVQYEEDAEDNQNILSSYYRVLDLQYDIGNTTVGAERTQLENILQSKGFSIDHSGDYAYSTDGIGASSKSFYVTVSLESSTQDLQSMIPPNPTSSTPVDAIEVTVTHN